MIRQLARAAADSLFPPRCSICQRVGVSLCDTCRSTLVRLANPRCAVCSAATEGSRRCDLCAERRPAYDRLFAPLLYVEPARRALLKMKFNHRPDIARGFAALMATEIHQAIEPAATLVPVPLHVASQRRRGFNQAELLSNEIGRLIERPVDRRRLGRLKETPRQATARDYEERQANVADAFEARALDLPADIWLVDDVCTTGATLDACARALKQAGARTVFAIVAAKTATSSHHDDD